MAAKQRKRLNVADHGGMEVVCRRGVRGEVPR